MCTVTYIPPSDENNFILTSNRDEKQHRSTVAPTTYMHNGIKLGFPKDEKAGGSWISVSEKGKISCLLNGGFEAHEKKEFHTLSRGTILIDFAASDLTAHEFFAAKTLDNVEPFTIIAIEQDGQEIKSLVEFVWDGKEKNFRQLNVNVPYIWSSATLYNAENRTMRKEWFAKFYTEFRNEISSEKILSFHSGAHTKDSSVNVVMQRDGGLKTVSITQVTPESGHLKMSYIDLLNNTNQQLKL